MSFAKKMLVARAGACVCSETILEEHITAASHTANERTCAGGGILWTVSWTLASQPSGYALEIWRSTASDSSGMAFWKRLAISATSTTETNDGVGSDGGGAAETHYRTYKVRIVPSCSANGVGPFCDGRDTTLTTTATNLCTV